MPAETRTVRFLMDHSGQVNARLLKKAGDPGFNKATPEFKPAKHDAGPAKAGDERTLPLEVAQALAGGGVVQILA